MISRPPIWRAASRAMPRPCAAIISPTAAAAGRYWIAGDVMNTPGRSLYVRLHGPESGPGAAGKWTDAATGEHGDLLDLIALNRDLRRLWRGHGRGALLSRPAPAGSTGRPIIDDAGAGGSSEAARRLFRAGRPVPGTPAEAYLRARGITGRSTGPPCATTRRSITANRSKRRSKPGRRCLPRSPISTAHITGIQRTWLDPRRPAKAPLADPRRALGHLLGNGVRFGAADRHARRRRRHRDHARAQIGAALLADDRRALGQPSRRPRPAPALCAASMSRATTTRPVSKRRTGCANAATPPASKSATSCRSMATSTSICAVSAPTACSRISRISSSPPTGRAFCPIAPLRSAAVSPASLRFARRRPEGGAARRCAGGVPQPEKSRAGGLPERRSAGGAGLQWRRPTEPPPPPMASRGAIFRRRQLRGGFASRSKIARPAPSSAALRPWPPHRRSRGTRGCNPSPPPAKGSP